MSDAGFTLVKGPSAKTKPPGCPNCHEGEFDVSEYVRGDVVCCNRCLRAWKLREPDGGNKYWSRQRRSDRTTQTGPK